MIARVRRRLNRALRPLPQDDRGLTMVELLVAMMISVALLAIVASFFVSTTRAALVASETRDTSTIAGNVANAVSQGVRFATQLPTRGQSTPAPAVVEASSTSLTVYTLLDTSTSLTPIKVRYTFAAGTWTEERWRGVTSNDGFTTFSSSTPTSTRTLGNAGPTRTGATPAFAYLDASGFAVGNGGALTAEQRALVAQVRLTVEVRGTDGSRGTTVTNTVSMPNLGYTGGVR